jgi:ribonuclease J
MSGSGYSPAKLFQIGVALTTPISSAIWSGGRTFENEDPSDLPACFPDFPKTVGRSAHDDIIITIRIDVSGKVLVTVMSSNIHRIQQVLNIAGEVGRKVVFVGRSVEQNVKTALDLGYLHAKENSILPKHRLNKLHPHQVCVVIAGSQGQEQSSLSRAAQGIHKLVTIEPQDKVIFASEAIPGNEHNVYGAIDMLARTGADVTYYDIDTSVHVSGHSSALEQKLLIAMTKPKHLTPIGGNYRHMIQYRSLARSLGYKDDKIHLLDNGMVVSVTPEEVKVINQLDLQQMSVTNQ